MIRLAENSEALSMPCGSSPFGCQIRSKAQAYGFDKPFVQFWADGEAAYGKTDGSVCIAGEITDADEARAFLSAVGTNEVVCSAENAEKLLELTSDTMILLDRNGICVDIAVHNADLWFLKENQLLGRNILQLLPSVTYRQVYPEFKKVLAYKEVSARNYELTIGSETYFFKCIMRPYEDMVLCQYRDITERSQRKRELEKKFKRIV